MLQACTIHVNIYTYIVFMYSTYIQCICMHTYINTVHPFSLLSLHSFAISLCTTNTGQSTVSAFDYLREASVVGGWDMTIRSGPVPEAKLIAVGEQPMVGLYRISKVHVIRLSKF